MINGSPPGGENRREPHASACFHTHEKALGQVARHPDEPIGLHFLPDVRRQGPEHISALELGEAFRGDTVTGVGGAPRAGGKGLEPAARAPLGEARRPVGQLEIGFGQGGAGIRPGLARLVVAEGSAVAVHLGDGDAFAETQRERGTRPARVTVRRMRATRATRATRASGNMDRRLIR